MPEVGGEGPTVGAPRKRGGEFRSPLRSLPSVFPRSREHWNPEQPCPLTQQSTRSGGNLGTSAESRVTCGLLIVAKTGTRLMSSRRTRVTQYEALGTPPLEWLKVSVVRKCSR